MVQHAIASGLAGQIEAGREEARRFLALAPSESSKLRQRVTIICVGFDTLLGKHADGRRLLRGELLRLPDQLGRQAAELKYELASTYFFDADWSAVRRWSSEALAADCRGMARVGSLATLAMAEFSLANLDHAKRSAAEAAQLFDDLTDDEVAARPGVSVFLTLAETHVERLASAVDHSERAIAISRTSGQRLMTIGLLAMQAQALAVMGRVPQLAAVADAATETALLSTSDMLLSMAMGIRAFGSFLAGDLPSALRFAEHSAGTALGRASPLSWGVRGLLAWVLLEMGEPGLCREQFTGPDGEPRLPTMPFFEGRAYELLTATEIALGNLKQAEVLAGRSAESAQRLGSNLPLALAQRALALVSLERGDHQTAITVALHSSEAAERAGAHVEAARGQLLAGRAIVASGDRPAAVATLQAAHTTLLTCGALHESDQAAKELRRLGRAIPRSNNQHSQPNVLGLTEREREVMERVAAGKTNREIAGALFLSARTIERHLARIFEKLDVHSRAAASSAFTRASNHPGR
jgi:DNA-binding NarL/FixJ family response regulator